MSNTLGTCVLTCDASLQEPKDKSSSAAAAAGGKKKPTKLPVSALGDGLTGSSRDKGRREHSPNGTGKSRKGGKGGAGGEGADAASWARRGDGAAAAAANGTTDASRSGRGKKSGRGNKDGSAASGNAASGSAKASTPSGQMPAVMNPFIPGRAGAANMYYNYAGMYYGAYGNARSAAMPDPAAVKEMVRKQIDYYFSVDNLCKDIFLRSKVS